MCSVAAACNFSFILTGTHPLSAVLSLNLRRRQLSASELAFVALEIEKYEAGEAKKRMAEGGKGKAQMPDLATGQARDKAAAVVGVRPRDVRDAEKTLRQAVRAVEQLTDYVNL